MEMADMLKSVLDNPDAMKKIMGMASAFASMPQSDPPPARAEAPREDRETGAASGEEKRPVSPEKKQTGDEHRIMLIKALMPYLSPERRDAADAMIRIMKIMQLAELSSKGKGE